jgi:SnoaL-like domain
MPSPVEIAVDTYIRAASARDPALRAQLVEACFAPEGRLVTRSGEIRGHAGVCAMLARFHADPQSRRIRVTSAIDARRTTFRYAAVAEFGDGRSLEVFDAGEIDASGRIAVLLTFAGPLGAPPSPSALRVDATFEP